MALVKCNECDGEISDQAKVCPHCGYADNIKDRKKSANDAKTMSTQTKITIAIVYCLTGWGMYSCTNKYMVGPESGPVSYTLPDDSSEYQRCQEKGHAYFKEIGSWPKLSDGRDAKVVAAERCGRTTGAFGGIK